MPSANMRIASALPQWEQSSWFLDLGKLGPVEVVTDPKLPFFVSWRPHGQFHTPVPHVLGEFVNVSPCDRVVSVCDAWLRAFVSWAALEAMLSLAEWLADVAVEGGLCDHSDRYSRTFLLLQQGVRRIATGKKKTL